MSRVIAEDVLRSIPKVLELHAPHLLPTVRNLLRAGLVEGPKGTPGSSVHGQLTAIISWENGGPILRALEEVERKGGYNAVFAGRQINLLILCWKQFSEPSQLQSNPV